MKARKEKTMTTDNALVLLPPRPKSSLHTDKISPLTHVGGISILQRTLYNLQWAGIGAVDVVGFALWTFVRGTGTEAFFPMVPAVLAVEMTFAHHDRSSVDNDGFVVHQRVRNFLVGTFQDASEGGTGDSQILRAFLLGLAVQVSLAQAFQFVQVQFYKTVFVGGISQGFERDSGR